MKKFIKFLIFLFCLCTFSFANDNTENKTNDFFDISSKAGILINADTNEILYSKNEHQKLFNASTTKIVTALVAIDKLNLNDQITAPADFQNPDVRGTNIAIDQNETLTFEQLLNAMLIASANDAAHLIAIHISGNEENFAKLMNEKVKDLGLENTHFENSHGLHNENHYSTCYDLSIIANQFIKKNILKEICTKQSYTIPPTNKKKQERNYIFNTNLFVQNSGAKMNYNGNSIPIYDSNVKGIKTGFTNEAGYCLISYIELNGKRMISVILGADNKENLYIDSKKLLYYGINEFKTQKIIAKDEIVTEIEVSSLKNSKLPLISANRIVKTMKNDFNKELISKEISIDENSINDDIKINQKLGTVKFFYDGEFIGSTDLLSSISINKQNLIGKIKYSINNNIVIKIIYIISKVFIAFIIWFIVLSILNKNKKNKNVKFIKNVRNKKDKK